jgi:hypothetical protein
MNSLDLGVLLELETRGSRTDQQEPLLWIPHVSVNFGSAH